mmetsp:Transcript_9503/g.14974  ORF Transcript_9503/g.14974 Transcript_9503/m.14974 type:complete len:181 (+) Transcript_9503:128-670(+)
MSCTRGLKRSLVVVDSDKHQDLEKEVFLAAQEGDTHRIRRFFEHECGNIDVLDCRRSTLLHVACAYHNVDAVHYLIQRGADVNASNYCRLTPLHHASANGYTSIAELLLLSGAKVDAKKDNGQTPLFLAARWGHLETARLLLGWGADPYGGGGGGGPAAAGGGAAGRRGGGCRAARQTAG